MEIVNVRPEGDSKSLLLSHTGNTEHSKDHVNGAKLIC